MTRTIEVEQELHRHAPGHFSLIVTVTDDHLVTSREFTYFKTNRTYPAFKGLIATLRIQTSTSIQDRRRHQTKSIIRNRKER
jgi:hypothetical protein